MTYCNYQSCVSLIIIHLIIMSVNLTEPTTPPNQRLIKSKALRSELFTKDLFEERNLSRGHEKEKTNQEVKILAEIKSIIKS